MTPPFPKRQSQIMEKEISVVKCNENYDIQLNIP